jgi:hypothetical protein
MVSVKQMKADFLRGPSCGILLSLAVGALLLCARCPGTLPSDDDTFEENDTYATAYPLPSVIKITTCKLWDQDWYLLKNVTGNYTITATCEIAGVWTPANDIDIELYSEGDPSSWIVHSEQASGTKQIELFNASGGNYYVLVYYFNSSTGSVTGGNGTPYSLVWQQTAP